MNGLHSDIQNLKYSKYSKIKNLWISNGILWMPDLLWQTLVKAEILRKTISHLCEWGIRVADEFHAYTRLLFQT